MKIPCLWWLESSLLQRTEHSHFPPPIFFFQFSFLDVHLPFSNVGEVTASFQQWGCQLHAPISALGILHLCLFCWGDWKMNDLREGKVWGYLFRFPAHLSACTRLPPLSPLGWWAGRANHRQQKNWRTTSKRPDNCSSIFSGIFFVCFFRQCFFPPSPPPRPFFWEEFDVRNVEGYGLNDVCVDSWSKVRNLSAFFSSAIADFGGKTHPNGRIPGGLSRFSTVEREREKNVDKTECRAQVRHKLFCSVITLYLNSWMIKGGNVDCDCAL